MRLRNAAAAFVMGSFAFTLAVPASAHIVASPNEAPANGYFRTALRVTHGCDGAATVAIRVRMPEGVTSVRPQMKPGWEITITMRALAKPVDSGHGQKITETVDEVTWRGGPLPDSYFDEFGLTMRVSAQAGTVLYLPTVQECEKGVRNWTGIPAANQKWGDLPSPAPFLRIQKQRGR